MCARLRLARLSKPGWLNRDEKVRTLLGDSALSFCKREGGGSGGKPRICPNTDVQGNKANVLNTMDANRFILKLMRKGYDKPSETGEFVKGIRSSPFSLD
jgi:hypothetical protein